MSSTGIAVVVVVSAGYIASIAATLWFIGRPLHRIEKHTKETP